MWHSMATYLLLTLFLIVDMSVLDPELPLMTMTEVKQTSLSVGSSHTLNNINMKY
jgi:hypothetical protein